MVDMARLLNCTSEVLNNLKNLGDQTLLTLLDEVESELKKRGVM